MYSKVIFIAFHHSYKLGSLLGYMLANTQCSIWDDHLTGMFPHEARIEVTSSV